MHARAARDVQTRDAVTEERQSVFGRAREAMVVMLERSAGETLLLSHDDADGLASAVVLHRALTAQGRASSIRLVGRFEQAWSARLADEVAARVPSLVIATDLGVPADVPFNVPTLILDHHVPRGDPSDDTTAVVSGYGTEPTPCSSVLAWHASAALGDPEPLAWLAALGVIGDFGEKALAAFPDLQRAATSASSRAALKAATTLVNAPRRASHGDAAAALSLLLKAEGPRDVTSGRHDETRALEADRDEVARELESARRVAPVFAGNIALLRMHSRCQVHPLVAQAWTGRLRQHVVMAANSGYRGGFVHVAVRSATGARLVDLLQAVRPEDLAADESFAGGHQQASGGALHHGTWERVAQALGFSAGQVRPPFPRRA